MFSILPWQGTVWCPEEPFPMRTEAELSLWGILSELTFALFMVLGFRWTWVWISNQSGINGDILRTLGSLLQLSIIRLPSDGNTWLRGLFWSVPVQRYLLPLLFLCSWRVLMRYAWLFEGRTIFFFLLIFIYLFDCTGCWLQHVGSCFVCLFVFLSYSMWNL